MSSEKKPDFSGLKAIFLNCTLKKSPQKSHTDGLIKLSMDLMQKNGVETELLRPADYTLPPGVYPDMTEYGYEKDDWVEMSKKVLAADILVLGTPIWLGEKSSICTKIIERLYALSGETNDKGQYIYYGKTGGCLITGNEDGVKHCSMSILYALQHIGYTIPPQADAGWIGEVGPGPSYLDDGSGGPENDFTNRNLTFMTYNLMHTAKMLKENNGITAYGNQRNKWADGERFGFDNAVLK
ncbi:flavodoxin family protein [Flexithrix dorotheae]|uniref:flavodoxin family protein n=1 Tax=Flexithrix dorotheae TaxID=70993 RepID=UPI0005C72980|nr:flavodoxin family protein [Flexithrix dorotheae]